MSRTKPLITVELDREALVTVVAGLAAAAARRDAVEALNLNYFSGKLIEAWQQDQSSVSLRKI